MEKLEKIRKIWLAVSISSALFGVVGIGMTALFAYKLMYFLMGLSILFVANGFYGTPFYITAYANAKLYKKVSQAILDGAECVEDMASATGLKESYAARAAAICIERGYAAGYELCENKIGCLCG